tara:strand:- start:811 stop:2118 length:1308 start_codon:yes stop_codon:yes gene_type:complete
MAWENVPIEGDGVGNVLNPLPRQWQHIGFLNQFIKILNECVPLYNSLFTDEKDKLNLLYEVKAGSNIQAASFFSSIQKMIDALIYVAVDPAAIVDQTHYNGGNYLHNDEPNYAVNITHGDYEFVQWGNVNQNWSMRAGEDGNTHLIFKAAANYILSEVEDSFFNINTKDVGWTRMTGDNGDEKLTGHVKKGDVIGPILFNQLYAACKILQNFAVITTNGENGFSSNVMSASAPYNNETGEWFKTCKEAKNELKWPSAWGVRNDPDAPRWSLDPPSFAGAEAAINGDLTDEVAHSSAIRARFRFNMNTDWFDDLVFHKNPVSVSVKEFGVLTLYDYISYDEPTFTSESVYLFDRPEDITIPADLGQPSGDNDLVTMVLTSDLKGNSFSGQEYGNTTGNPITSYPCPSKEEDFIEIGLIGWSIKPYVCFSLNTPDPN